MNAAAVIFGVLGSAVAVFAASKQKPDTEREALQVLRAAPAAAPPPPRLPASMVETIPAHAVEVLDGGAPANAVQAGRAPRQAARELLSYVAPLISSGRAEALGTKDEPNDIVRAAQRDMKVAADGVYGEKTRARGKELLGLEFPARTSNRVRVKIGPARLDEPAARPGVLRIDAKPPEPASTMQAPPEPPALDVQVNEHAPREAAAALYAYVTQRGADLGSKGRPSVVVKAAQRDMGGIPSDGVYGPATRARGKTLTGKTFPPRS